MSIATETVTTPAAQVAETAPAAAPVVTAPATGARAEIDAMAAELGLDPSKFAGIVDPAAAQAAAQAMIETSMQHGRTVLAQIQQSAPQINSGATTPLTTASNGAVIETAQLSLKPLDLNGIDATDPVAAVLKDVHATASQAVQVANHATAKMADMEKRHAAQARASMEVEIDRVFDNLKDPLFGAGRNRTSVQETTRKEVRQMADYALASAWQNGLPEPSLETRLRQATFQYKAQRPGGATVQQTVTGGGGLNQTSPQVVNGVKQMGINEKWSENPEFRRILGM